MPHRSQVSTNSDGHIVVSSFKPDVGARNRTWEQAHDELQQLGCELTGYQETGGMILLTVVLPKGTRHELCGRSGEQISIFDLGGDQFLTIMNATWRRPNRTLTVVSFEVLQVTYRGIAELLTEHLRQRLALAA